MKNLNFKIDFLYTIYFLIFINFLLNYFSESLFEKIITFNYFDLASSLLLFLFLYLIGRNVKQAINLPYISTGIVVYLLSIFLLDNLILLLTSNISFSQVFLLTSSLWIVFLKLKKTRFSNIIQVFLSFVLLNIYNYSFLSQLNKFKNIIGDVEDIHLQHVKNIYEKSYYFSVNNPTLEGYPQLVAYFQASLNKISLFTDMFENISASVNVMYFLSIFLFYELEFSRKSKYILVCVFTSIIYNSEWLKLLFVDSLMTEGTLSYLFTTLIVSLGKTYKDGSNNLNIIFFFLGLLYLSKQFISLISLITIILFLLNKKVSKFALFGFSGLIIKEISYLTFFQNIEKNYHLKEVNFVDTIFDLLLLRDVKLENIYIIFKNLFIDKPITIIFIYFIFLCIYYFLKVEDFNSEIFLYLVPIFINLIFVLVLYVSIWRNMELESPIRYLLNFLHLVLVVQFKIIDFLKSKFIQKFDWS